MTSDNDSSKGFSGFGDFVSDVTEDLKHPVHIASDTSQPVSRQRESDAGLSIPHSDEVNHKRGKSPPGFNLAVVLEKLKSLDRRYLLGGAAALLIGLYQLILPHSYHECILDKMPGTRNDVAAYAIARSCREKFPDTSMPDSKKTMWGTTVRDCVSKYAKTSGGESAPYQIRRACFALYPNE